MRSCKEIKWQNVCNSIVSFLPFPSFASLGPLSSTFLRFGQCGLLLLLRQRVFQGFAFFSSWPPWQEVGGSGSPLLLFQAPSGFHSVSEQFPLINCALHTHPFFQTSRSRPSFKFMRMVGSLRSSTTVTLVAIFRLVFRTFFVFQKNMKLRKLWQFSVIGSKV